MVSLIVMGMVQAPGRLLSSNNGLIGFRRGGQRRGDVGRRLGADRIDGRGRHDRDVPVLLRREDRRAKRDQRPLNCGRVHEMLRMWKSHFAAKALPSCRQNRG